MCVSKFKTILAEIGIATDLLKKIKRRILNVSRKLISMHDNIRSNSTNSTNEYLNKMCFKVTCLQSKHIVCPTEKKNL